MCLRNVLVNLIQVMGCIMNYYQLSILLWGFFPAKCAILFISLAIILFHPTLYSHSLTGLQNLACDVFLQEYIHIYIISVCVCLQVFHNAGRRAYF